MGLLNLNTIGAFILTIFLIGAIPRLHVLAALNQGLQKAGLPAALIVVAVLFYFFLVGAKVVDHELIRYVLHWPAFFVHEAGHIYWSVFGDVMKILGGTLNELFLFGGLAVFCEYNRWHSVGSVFIWWTGYNLFGTADYISSATENKLHSMFGPNALHDWNYLLTEASLLHLDKDIGSAVRVFGGILCIAGICFLIYNAHLSSRVGEKKETDF